MFIDTCRARAFSLTPGVRDRPSSNRDSSQAWIPSVGMRSETELSSTTTLQVRGNDTCSFVPTPREPSRPADNREAKERGSLGSGSPAKHAPHGKPGGSRAEIQSVIGRLRAFQRLGRPAAVLTTTGRQQEGCSLKMSYLQAPAVEPLPDLGERE